MEEETEPQTTNLPKVKIFSTLQPRVYNVERVSNAP